LFLNGGVFKEKAEFGRERKLESDSGFGADSDGEGWLFFLWLGEIEEGLRGGSSSSSEGEADEAASSTKAKPF